MTTYPLSEPATIYAVETSDDASPATVGRGTLKECADIVAGLSPDRQQSVAIHMDDLDIKFGPADIRELLQFLDEETSGLSNTEITEIKSPDA